MKCEGIPASGGIGIGEAVLVAEPDLGYGDVVFSGVEAEKARLAGAVAAFIRETSAMAEALREQLGDKQAEILSGQVMMVSDPYMTSQMNAAIENGVCAESAVDSVCGMYIELISSMEDELMRQRATDIGDLRARMLGILLHVEEVDLSTLPAGTVLAAHDLTPSMTVGLKKENVAAIRVVKSFVREQHEDEKYTKACQDLYKQFVKAESRLSFNNPSMLLAVYGCNLALSWFGAHYVLNGIISTGQLNALFGYVMNILMSLMMLSMVFVMLSMSAASAHRIIEVLDETTDLPPAKTPVNEVKDGGVEFDHVTFKYKHGTGKPVLSDITFRIQPGETLGIIGGTGSAKSSLVQLIPRLYDVAEGSVKVGGVDVRDYNLDVLRHDVSMVLQKNVLFSGTILDNLRWGDENATEAECIEACRLACADEFIERFPDKYNTWIEQGGSNVSGGQKQRLTIARALLRKPKVLILDDSTSAVDTATDAKIRQAFREKLPGTTKIIIAQRISSVQDADRILVLDNGQIDGLGTHEELLATNKIYQEVYTSQTQGGGDFDKQGGEE